MHCLFWVQVTVCCSGLQCTQCLKQCFLGHFSLGCGDYVTQLSALGFSLGRLAENWFCSFYFGLFGPTICASRGSLPSALRQPPQRDWVGSLQASFPAIKWNDLHFPHHGISRHLLSGACSNWSSHDIRLSLWSPGTRIQAWFPPCWSSRQMLRGGTWVMAIIIAEQLGRALGNKSNCWIPSYM